MFHAVLSFWPLLPFELIGDALFLLLQNDANVSAAFLQNECRHSDPILHTLNVPATMLQVLLLLVQLAFRFQTLYHFVDTECVKR